MKHTKKKTLREIYATDPAARAFLKKHPEFNDRFLEQSEVNNPGFNTTQGRYTLTEIAPDHQAYGALMLEAAASLPPDHRYKALLEAYYGGMEFAELQKRFKVKTRNALYFRIHAAKKAALKHMTRSQRVVVRDQTPIATRTFTFNGEARFVYLVMDELTQDHVWVRENGEVLPDYAQDILDNDDNIKSWDQIWF